MSYFCKEFHENNQSAKPRHLALLDVYIQNIIAEDLDISKDGWLWMDDEKYPCLIKLNTDYNITGMQ